MQGLVAYLQNRASPPGQLWRAGRAPLRRAGSPQHHVPGTLFNTLPPPPWPYLITVCGSECNSLPHGGLCLRSFGRIDGVLLHFVYGCGAQQPPYDRLHWPPTAQMSEEEVPAARGGESRMTPPGGTAVCSASSTLDPWFSIVRPRPSIVDSLLERE